MNPGTGTIRQTVTFKTAPHEVYEALMDSRKHSRFTGSKALISRKVGGKFSVWEGSINGKNLELVPDKKIVQEWRSEEEGWPKGHYSKATFLLKESKGETILKFTQAKVPLAAYDAINEGWHDYYWKPLKEFLEAK